MKQILIVLFLLSACSKQATKNETLADCLTKKGVVLYGASWCKFCKKQEQLFGSAYSRLARVSCDEPGAPGSDPGCLDDEGGYCFPAWDFPDGKRLCGVHELADLAKESGCPYSDGR